MVKSHPSRRWWQFSVRSLFILTLVVAAFFAGMAMERRRGETTIRTEGRVRQWLGKNSYQLVGGHRVLPSMEWEEWIAEGKIIPNAEPALRTFLWQRDSTVELPLVAASLGRLGTSDSVPALIDALNPNDIYLTIAAARSLGELRDLRAIKPLGTMLQLARDTNIRANIVVALADIGGPDATEYLKSAAEDMDPFVADCVKDALGTKDVVKASERATHDE